MRGEKVVRIGDDTGEHLKIAVLRRCCAEYQDVWDGNWLNADVSAFVGGFVAKVAVCLRTDEFEQFCKELGPLYDSLDGSAAFTSLEHCLTIKVDGDGIGHFRVQCELSDAPSSPNRLSFELAFEQTELPTMLAQLDAILEEFPVVGRRGH